MSERKSSHDRITKVSKSRYNDNGIHESVHYIVPGLQTEHNNLSDGSSQQHDKHDMLTHSLLSSTSSSLSATQQNVFRSNSMKRESKKRISPSSSLSQRIPASSYLAQRLFLDDDSIVAAMRKSAPPRPVHTNTILTYLNEDEQQCGGKNIVNLQGLGTDAVSSNLSQKMSNRSIAEKRSCLTNPSQPKSNEGFDNADGNLIVYENDILSIQNKQIHVHLIKSQFFSLDKDSECTNFRVLSLLGQGTFAQVFKCEDVRTGQNVAVKVVKNKPAYTKQAAIEIEIFESLATTGNHNYRSQEAGTNIARIHDENSDITVNLLCYFMYRSHLCLVFELLGKNLYEVLKRRQFRGLPIGVVRSWMKQALEGIKTLGQKSIVHCDLKPENILIVNNEPIDYTERLKIATDAKSLDVSNYFSDSELGLKIKLIDFGSACFEGQSSHTYIQSRFYRSPEVLLGLEYDSAIDVWSLGCVAAELFLGLPILPGVHEHDQLTRICEMIGKIPDWMIEQGSKTSSYFIRKTQGGVSTHSLDLVTNRELRMDGRLSELSVWRLKSSDEFISLLSDDEKAKRGGATKIEQRETNRYFKRKLLEDILSFHGSVSSTEEKEMLPLFIHFLKGMLEIDPWKRYTAFQASVHPFITGNLSNLRRSSGFVRPMHDTMHAESSSVRIPVIHWVPPWDPSICQRKLQHVQKSREKSDHIRNFSLLKSNPDYDQVQLRDSLVSSQNMMSPTRDFRIHSPPSQILPVPFVYNPSCQSHVSNNSFMRRSHSDLQSLITLSNQTKVAFSPFVPRTGELITSIPTPLMIGTNYVPFYNFGTREMQREFVPQSFSGVYFDPFHPVTPGDLGYALQRPGVVPMGGDSSIRINDSLHQQSFGVSPSLTKDMSQATHDASLDVSSYLTSNTNRRFSMHGSVSNIHAAMPSQVPCFNSSLPCFTSPLSSSFDHQPSQGIMDYSVYRPVMYQPEIPPVRSGLLAQQLAEHLSIDNSLAGVSQDTYGYMQQPFLFHNSCNLETPNLQAIQTSNNTRTDGRPPPNSLMKPNHSGVGLSDTFTKNRPDSNDVKQYIAKWEQRSLDKSSN